MSGSKKIQPMNFITVGFFGIILSGMLSLFVKDMDILTVILFLIVVSGGVLAYGYISLQAEKRNSKAKVIENSNTFHKEYDIYAEQLGVKNNDMQITLVDNAHIPHYLWIADNRINIFPMEKYFERNSISAVSRPNISQLQVLSVPIEDILYFEEIGELRKYTNRRRGNVGA